jgi:hypothetical protein
MIVKEFDHDCKRVVVFLLLSIVEKSGLSSENVISIQSWVNKALRHGSRSRSL